MRKTFTKGFTLIELLVVIAIIGILASIVLVSLNSARGKGRDAAVASNLNSIRTQAEIVADNNAGKYGTVCVDTTVNAALNAAKNSSVSPTVTVVKGGTGGSWVTCNDTDAGWAAEAPLNVSGAGWFCVDSRGIAATTSASTLGSGSDITCN